MELVVISPEAADEREQTALVHFFAAGLQSYHLRKPSWNPAQLTAWLRALPEKFHPRIVLHAHHELQFSGSFALGGLHWKDDGGAALASASPTIVRSRAAHDLATLRASLDRFDRVLFSPVFPSISKPGHAPDASISRGELRTLLALPRRARVIALGGIDCSRLASCHELGFDGVAVLGAVWRTPDPVKSFNELQQALLAHAA